MPLIIKKQPVQLGEEKVTSPIDTTLKNVVEVKNQSSPSTLVDNNKGIVVEKFIVEITRYPDGKSFSKIYSIGEQKKINKELAKPAKGITKLNINDKEVEELE